jgi:hypothetical protein
MATMLMQPNPSATLTSVDQDIDRRDHQRLDLELPLECRCAADGDQAIRAVTKNVSTGGLYFEHDGPKLAAGALIDISLTLPASEGVWPYEGRVRCAARILRSTTIEGQGLQRGSLQGIAAQFVDRLRFSF